MREMESISKVREKRGFHAKGECPSLPGNKGGGGKKKRGGFRRREGGTETTRSIQGEDVSPMHRSQPDIISKNPSGRKKVL